MSSVLISVILPVYNVNLTYFHQAVLSVLNQSISDFELIIVDDGSLPQLDVLDFKDSRIKLIRLDKNMGISFALNVGLNYASGSYIARMDSDDISYQWRFEHQLSLMKKHDIVSSNVILINKHGSKVGKSKTLPFHNFLRRIQLYTLRLNPVNHPTIFAKAEVFHVFRYDELKRRSQDFDLWMRIRKNYKIFFDSRYVLDYRVFSNS